MKKSTENKTNSVAELGESNSVLRLDLRHADDTKEAAITAALINPATLSAVTLQQLNPQLNVNALIAELALQVDAVSAGRLDRPETMLLAQAQTLDGLFHALVRKAIGEDRLLQCEAHMRLAMKAQSQCRTTLEALAEIKNPRSVAFVKQANIAAGNQQVNNGDNVTVRAGARTQENEIPPNKLLTETSYETLDAGRTLTTSGVNSPMEAVGAINGAADEAG
jgi:hypothetical protein